ncbi:cyclin-A1 [Osmerus eperlanus]|uniref:cyclin-A1 n=1 Tax=Osmerus eperlanus TaxID=29151 RepID=UPI002E130D96
MSFNTAGAFASRSSQENVAAGSSRMDPIRMQRAKQRTVLGLLSENEQHSRLAGGQPSKLGSISENSQTTFPGCTSSSSFDVFVDDPCEVVLPACSEVVVSPQLVDEDRAALQHKDFRLFLDLSSGSCMDTSMQSLPDEPMTSEDMLCLSEYAEDIHRHLRESEMKCQPKHGYMRKQPDITNCMRIILMDWLVEVCLEYKLCNETFFLAVNYVDRFLSCMSVLRGKLQLLGTAAIMLAAKYEEIYPPEVDEFVYITDDTYTKKQLLRMEHLVLKVLAFDMTVPTTHHFLLQYMTVQSVCSKTQNLALYVSELSLLEVDPFLQYVPSMVAAAAYCLANYTVNRTFWPDALGAFTGYTLSEIARCLKDLHKLYLGAESRPQQAIREKYKSSRYGNVSAVTPPPSLPFH